MDLPSTVTVSASHRCTTVSSAYCSSVGWYSCHIVTVGLPVSKLHIYNFLTWSASVFSQSCNPPGECDPEMWSCSHVFPPSKITTCVGHSSCVYPSARAQDFKSNMSWHKKDALTCSIYCSWPGDAISTCLSWYLFILGHVICIVSSAALSGKCLGSGAAQTKQLLKKEGRCLFKGSTVPKSWKTVVICTGCTEWRWHLE